MTPPTATVETDRVEAEVHELTIRSQALEVIDAASYETAGEFLRGLKGYEQNVRDLLDEAIQQAHATHKTLTGKRKVLLDPAKAAEKLVKVKMATWVRAEEAKAAEAARIAEAAAQAEAKRQAEEEQLAAAAEAEANGDLAEAEAILCEEPTPAPVAPIAPKPAAPKVSGVSIRKVWKAQVTDLLELVKAVAAGTAPITLLKADPAALNSYAKSWKEQAALPGVRVWADDVVAAGR